MCRALCSLVRIATITRRFRRPGADRVPSSLRGAGPVAVGLMVAGLCTYAFLAVAGRSLGPSRFASVSALWGFVFILGPGVYTPLQQEVGRALAARRAEGVGGRDVVRKAGLAGGAVTVLLVAGTLAAGGWIVSTFFAGAWGLLFALVIALVGFWLSFLTRGVVSGLGRFERFGALLGGESAIRLAIALGLVLIGVEAPVPFGMAVAWAPFVAAGLVMFAGRRPRVAAGPPAPWRDLSRALGWLLASSLLSQLLVNAAILVVRALGGGSASSDAGRFLAALVIARVSLYLFQAVEAVLLPNLAVLVAEGRLVDYRAAMRRLVAIILVLIVVSTAAAFALGPFVVRAMFGPQFVVSRSTMAMLAAASAVYVLASAQSGALIAIGGHKWTAYGWGAACVAFTGVVIAIDDLFWRVEAAYLVGSVVAAVVLTIALHHLAVSRVRDALADETVLDQVAFDS